MTLASTVLGVPMPVRVPAPAPAPAPTTAPAAKPAQLPWNELDPQDAEGDATRSAYLKAATRLVNEHGYRGASVDRIAAQLQLTKGSFYHHHETKEELIAACFERSVPLHAVVNMISLLHCLRWSHSGERRK